eukprot:GHVQ01005565.1.p1 GENE.GHVQ01005565.1~~GHVQ01005565.1.p1  ORF type:complete len:668 (+),score=72.95 GHVQ01005565.1:180-2183(+)
MFSNLNAYFWRDAKVWPVLPVSSLWVSLLCSCLISICILIPLSTSSQIWQWQRCADAPTRLKHLYPAYNTLPYNFTSFPSSALFSLDVSPIVLAGAVSLLQPLAISSDPWQSFATSSIPQRASQKPSSLQERLVALRSRPQSRGPHVRSVELTANPTSSRTSGGKDRMLLYETGSSGGGDEGSAINSSLSSSIRGKHDRGLVCSSAILDTHKRQSHLSAISRAKDVVETTVRVIVPQETLPSCHRDEEMVSWNDDDRRLSLDTWEQEQQQLTQKSFTPDGSPTIVRAPGLNSCMTTPSSLPLPTVPPQQHPRKAVASKKKQLLSLLSGGLAGTIAAGITTPIEVVKTHLQSSRGSDLSFWGAASAIMNNSPRGFFALYTGLLPTLIGIIPTRSSYFWGYNFAKNRIIYSLGFEPTSPAVHMLGAMFAGVLSNTLSNPIWMIRTRMQLLSAMQMAGKATREGEHSDGGAAYTGYGDAIRQIYRQEGLGGFWKGLAASYWGVSEACINWAIYENLKTRITQADGGYEGECPQSMACSDDSNQALVGRMSLTAVPVSEKTDERLWRMRLWLRRRVPQNVQLCLAAGLSKLIASSITYPHEVARTRVRENAVNGVFKYTGMFQALRRTLREEGIKSWYAGMGTHLLRVVPNNAILLVSFELVDSWLNRWFV